MNGFSAFFGQNGDQNVLPASASPFASASCSLSANPTFPMSDTVFEDNLLSPVGTFSPSAFFRNDLHSPANPVFNPELPFVSPPLQDLFPSLPRPQGKRAVRTVNEAVWFCGKFD